MSSDQRKDDAVPVALPSQTPSPSPVDLEQAFQAHHRRVFQVAFRVTGNSSDAEDVLQNIFVRLMKLPSLPSGAEALGGYLHRAAVNASIDLLRLRRASQRVPLEEIAVRLSEEGDSPETQQQGRELADWLRSAICRLSPQSAEIFSLRYLEGYKNLEIAEMVQTSPGVVGVVLHRARQRLREELAEFLGEPL